MRRSTSSCRNIEPGILSSSVYAGKHRNPSQRDRLVTGPTGPGFPPAAASHSLARASSNSSRLIRQATVDTCTSPSSPSGHATEKHRQNR